MARSHCAERDTGNEVSVVQSGGRVPCPSLEPVGREVLTLGSDTIAIR